MKKFASFFQPKVIDSEEQKDQLIFTKIEYVPSADENKRYEVYEKTSKLDPWGDPVDVRPTLVEAEERASMKPKNNYQGLFRKGVRMDDDYVQERKEADDITNHRRKVVYKDYEKDKKNVYEGVPEKQPVYGKKISSPVMEIPVEVERKKKSKNKSAVDMKQEEKAPTTRKSLGL